MEKLSQPRHVDSYYVATANDTVPFPWQDGNLDCDVVVIGGGLTGVSAALNLTEAGMNVVLLEAGKIGWAASGRNGGQMIVGYACGIDTFGAFMPEDDVKRVWNMGVESIDIIRERVKKHDIQCDLRDGYLTVANKPKHVDELREWQEESAKRFGYTGQRWISREELGGYVQSDRYLAGLYDGRSGHLHCLNYNLGLARAAVRAGAKVYEFSPATSIEQGNGTHTVKTARGVVRAKYIVMACNTFVASLNKELDRKIMPVGTYVIATEPLPEDRFKNLMPAGAAICDSRFVLDYYRPTVDRRVLWGGKVSYSTLPPANLAGAMRRDMLKTFPQLADVKVEYAWGGMCDITMNRAPHFGRIAPTIYFAQGFSGHGVNITGLAGKLIADAIVGQASRFDLFTKIRHHDFPGGKLMRTPALVLAMAWYQLQDLL